MAGPDTESPHRQARDPRAVAALDQAPQGRDRYSGDCREFPKASDVVSAASAAKWCKNSIT